MSEDLRQLLAEACAALEADQRSYGAKRRGDLARRLRAASAHLELSPPPDAWERLRAVMARVVVTDELIGATLLMGRTQESLEGYIAAVRELVRIAVAIERDRAESEALALVEVARHIAEQGAIDHDSYVCSADLGRALRTALDDYDRARRHGGNRVTMD